MDVSLLGYQYEFISSNSKKAFLLGGIGCIDESTLIDTIDGKIAAGDITKSTYYKCFDGSKFIYSLGTAPFLKGKGNLYRVIHEQGEFVAYGSHLIFCEDRMYRTLDEVRILSLANEDFLSLFPTDSGSCQLAPLLGEGHSIHKGQDSQSCYQGDNRLGGGQSLFAKDTGQASFPSLAYALESSQPFSPLTLPQMDALRELGQIYIHLSELLAHHSKKGYTRLLEVLAEVFSGLNAPMFFEHILHGIQQFQQSPETSFSRQIKQLFSQRQMSYLIPPESKPSSKILSIELQKCDYYFDLHVPVFNNYVAEGAIHHNSGKSYAGAHFVVRMLSEYPNAKGLITANVYNQLMNATVQTITEQLTVLGIRHNAVLSGARKRIELDTTSIHLYSLEKPDNMRGIEIGWWLGDESAFAKHDAIKIARGRLRQKKAPLFERHTSSPNGFNWAYDEFENRDARNKTIAKHLIRAKTKENIFLPEGYYDTLLSDYGGENNPLAIQELFGQFVNLSSGAIYWAFDRDQHVAPCSKDPRFPVYSCQDFNIDNMCNCYIQRIGGHYYVFKENILSQTNANTETAAINTVEQLGTNNVFVIPDSTAKARKTSSSSGMTDLHILESYGLQVLPTRNPLIRDRQNSVNNIFKQNKITIDPNCKHLIKELHSLSTRDEEGSSSHVAVALGYGIFKFDPLVKIQQAKISHYA